MIRSKLSASHCLINPSLPDVKNWWVLGTNTTLVTVSSWAKIDLWQSPKSRPQILIFRSPLPVTIRVESSQISRQDMGSLWPYNFRKNWKHENHKRISRQSFRYYKEVNNIVDRAYTMVLFPCYEIWTSPKRNLK